MQRSRLGDQRTTLEFEKSRVEFQGARIEFQGKSSLRFREAGLSFREPGLSFKVTRELVLSLITPEVIASVGGNPRPHPERRILYLRQGFESSNHKRGLFHHRFPTNNLKALSLKESCAPSSISVW